jgi:predicted outer membrane repeat protein
MWKTPKRTADRWTNQSTFELLEPRLLLSATSVGDEAAEIVIDASAPAVLAEASVPDASSIEIADDQASYLTVSNGIISVDPTSANQGDTLVPVTFTLDGGLTPPLPPSQVNPSGAWIGGIAVSSVSRNGLLISGFVTIPIDQTPGMLDVSVEFPIPNNTLEYTKSAAFEVIAVDQGPDVFYVDVNNTSGSWDGESWATAYQTIGDALDDAGAAGEGEIWIADGTYTPTSGTDRSASFQLVEGIALYGGFEGVDETERTDRDPDTYATVLSGDIGVGGDSSDNSFHVVLGAGGAVLDGVTITGGNADGLLIDSIGGGMLNTGGIAVTVNDCLFTENYADEGGAMFNFNSSIATITNSQFIDNTANRGGAMVNRIDAHAEISDTLFESNTAAWRGGAVFNDYGSSPIFTTCEFISNHTGGHGGAIYTDNASSPNAASPVITGGTFTDNSADYRGGAIANYNRTTPEIRNSAFSGNTAGTGGGAIANDYYVTATLSGNTFGVGDDVDSDATSTVVYEASTVSDGYTLFAPIGSTTTYLMNNDGQFVHTWDSAYRPGLSTYLLESGNLMRTGNLGDTTPFSGTGGTGGVVQEIQWDGTVVWEYEYSSATYLQHHDIEVLPNGNVLMIAWEYKTSAEAIAAGRDTSLLSAGELWPAHIVEIEPSGATGGSIVWQWNAWDHLVQDYDAGQANYGVVGDHPELIDLNYTSNPGADWLHVNSIDYNAEFDQILLSVHNFSEVWVIDHDTTTAEASGAAGDLLYRWGNPQAYDAGDASDQEFYAQHDAQWIASGLDGAGNILVFNNGFNRPEGAYSTVEEIAPPVDASGVYSLTPGSDYGPASQTWVYTAPTPTDFYGERISGAQRLPNGNTLICSGPDGLFFEVNADNDIVWQYDYDGGVFRAERYSPDHQGLDGRDLTPPAAAPVLEIESIDQADQAAAATLTYTVVDTNQTIFYSDTGVMSEPSAGSAFYGQDAQFAGNAPSYTLSGDGLTVYDNVTDLTWTQSPDFDGDGDIDAADKFTYDEAVAYAETLNTANFGGFDDWRLPDIKEVYSLIDFSGKDPSGYEGTSTVGLVPFIDTDYFDFGYGDTTAGERIIDAQMASSTLYVGNTGNDGGRTMFGVNFADGRIKGYGLTLAGSDKTFYAYFVRGNTDYGDNDLVDNADDTITDAATGLMWSQDDSGSGLNWEDALAWVQQKNTENYLGYSDWRMPDVKELQSIVDYSRSPQTTGTAAIDPLFNITSITIEDGSTDWPHFWSGTTHANYLGGGQSASYVAFGEAMGNMNGNWIDVHGAGAQRSDPKDGDPADYPTGHGPQGDAIRIFNYVRLVRDANVIVNDDPVADSGGPYATETDVPVLLDGSGSSDSDGTIVSYEWDLDNDGQYDDAVGATTSFESAAAGAFIVGLKVTDDGGAEDIDTTVVNVTPAGWTGVAFVDADNDSGTYDGLSWQTAFAGVQAGLDLAGASGGGQVWVAEGVYTPSGASDRGVSFELQSGVDLYGGFEGGEDDLAQRDWTAFETVLSGDIGIEGDSSDNSYHVVIGADGALLDGFAITGGRADELGGGGVWNHQASPTISNTVISDNYAEKGGGMYNSAGSSPTITNVVLASNTAATSGGAIANEDGSSPTITNATIAGNFAGDQGAGLYQGSYDPDTGAASNPTLINTIVWGNEIGSVGPAAISSWHLSNPAVTYSLVGVDPLFADASAGDFTLTAGSPAIDAADGSSAPAADIAGNARHDDPIADSGSGAPTYADMGAYEYQGIVAPVTVQDVEINSGYAQRGSIDSIALTLSGPATLQAGSLSLHNDATGEDFALDAVPFEAAGNTWDTSSVALTDGPYTATLDDPAAEFHQFAFHVLKCDMDGDAEVGDGDLDTLIGQFGLSGSNLAGDLDKDGFVGLGDFVALRENFGNTLPAPAPIPVAAAAPNVDILSESVSATYQDQWPVTDISSPPTTFPAPEIDFVDPLAALSNASDSDTSGSTATPHLAATGEYDLRPLSDDQPSDSSDNLLSDILAEAVVLIPLSA